MAGMLYNMEVAIEDSYMVPQYAIDLVTQEIRKQMGHFIHELSEPRRSLRSDLASMCLVQRSWLRPAQQALQYRIVVRSVDALANLSLLQHIGPNTREFIFSGRWSSDEMRRLLVVLGRMPDLRFLAIGLEFYNEHIHYETLTDAIRLAGAAMPALEGLFFPVAKRVPDDSWYMSRDRERGKSYLDTLFAELPRMKNLSMLWISRFGCSLESVHDAVPKEFEESRLPRLQTVVLQVPSDPTPRNYLRWFFESQDDNALKNLIIYVDNYNKQLDNLSDLHHTFLDLALPSIENLHVEVLFKEFSVFYKVTLFLSALLQSCTALRALQMGIDIFKAIASLPASLERLHLEVRDLAYQGISSWSDAYIYALLAKSQPFPRLRLLEIGGPSTQEQKGLDLERGIMPRVSSFCRRNADLPVFLRYAGNGNLDIGAVLLYFVDPHRVGYNALPPPHSIDSPL